MKHLSVFRRWTSTARQLFAAGAAITVDDFGAGHSNLTRILDLPEAGAVKLDRYVMRTCLTRDPKLLAHLIDFVHDCGKLVIAQGVESRQQAQQLVKLGADYLQGFYYAMPMDADELCRFLHPDRP
ncbi:EAL domain-containing protein [Fournierella massiliensis]|uniref:EAL domain-containing protein n=1 Tax=Allofournierella massiliensis TaxID=1650663 RepID=UPI00352177B8